MSEKNERKNVSKKYQNGILLVIGLILGIGIGLKLINSKSSLELDGLSNFDYEVVQINQDDDSEDYEVKIETENENKEELIDLAQEISKEVRSYEKNRTTEVVVQVYNTSQSDTTIKPESTEKAPEVPITIVKPDLDNPNHTVSVEVAEMIKVYSLIDKSSLEKDIEAVDNWEIYNSRRELDKHLVGSVALPTGTSEDNIYRQLKAIESEMTRFNEMSEDGVTYFEHEYSENELYYAYSSLYPTSLIKIEVVEKN